MLTSHPRSSMPLARLSLPTSRNAAALFVVALLGSACTVTEDNFDEAMADAWCDKYQECYRSEFEDDYDNVQDCSEDVDNTYESIQDGAHELGCELNEEEATRYRDDLRAAECSEFNDSFWLTFEDEIWDC